MILYFSATGNGKYIAEQIADATNEKCMSIADCICEDKYCFSNEKILGIVVPTYFWRLPRIVAEYLDKLRIENCGYTFFLASYGTTTGMAGRMAKDIMAHHGQKFDAYYSVIMPDTWTPVFDLTDKNRVDRWLSDGKKQLELVTDNIISKRKGNFIDRKLPKWLAAIPAAYMYATERKKVRPERDRWRMDIRSGNRKSVKCVLDVFTGVPNLQSAMAMEKLTDMASIKIHIQEFRNYLWCSTYFFNWVYSPNRNSIKKEF